MEVYQFTEQPYYPAWNDHKGSLRINLPNSLMDPNIAGDLFHRYYDEWKLADELGYSIMLNEHHQTATCMSSTCIVGLSVLARETKKARLLVLGYPATAPIRCGSPRSFQPSTSSRADGSTWASSRACPTNFQRRTRTLSR